MRKKDVIEFDYGDSGKAAYFTVQAYKQSAEVRAVSWYNPFTWFK
jgi:hypothetical protein